MNIGDPQLKPLWCVCLKYLSKLLNYTVNSLKVPPLDYIYSQIKLHELAFVGQRLWLSW